MLISSLVKMQKIIANWVAIIFSKILATIGTAAIGW